MFNKKASLNNKEAFLVKIKLYNLFIIYLVV